MPVEVHIPVRLRVSPRALAEHAARIDAALGRALARALRRSQSALRQAYGGYLDPRIDVAAFGWSGAALAGVPPDVRSGVEQRLAGTIDRLAREALRAAPALEVPLTGEPAERHDPQRELGLGRYRIDSYLDGNETALPLQRHVSQPHSAPPPTTRGWYRVDVYDNYDPQHVRAAAHQEAGRQNVALPWIYGLLVRAASANWWTLILTADDFAGARRVALNFSPQMERRPIGLVRGALQYEECEILPPLTSGSMTEEQLPGERDELLARLQVLLGATIGTAIHDSLDASQQQADNGLDQHELDQLVRQERNAEIGRMADELHGRRYLLRIDWGALRFNLAFERSIAALLGWDGSTPAVIMPLLGDVPAERPDAGAGAGRGAGAAHGSSGDGGGGGAGAREADGTGSRYGTEDDGKAAGGTRIFPALGGFTPPMGCEPFLGSEPALSQLAGDGAHLLRMIDEIAERLDIDRCDYAASFCIGAAQRLAGYAIAVAQVAGTGEAGDLTRPARPGTGGNLGHAEFRPVASRGIQLLRRLAQAAARIAQLRRVIRTLYLDGEGRALLGGEYARNAAGWVLRFEEAVAPSMKQGVGELFAQTCQLVMLQLLDTSADQIAARKANLHAYAPLFRDILVRHLSDIGALTALRDRLRAWELAQGVNRALDSTGGTLAGAALPGWVAAARALASACAGSEGFSHLPGVAQEIVEQDGVARIRDAHGFMWTRAALEQAIAEQRGGAESIDPLIQQLAEIPETVDRFRRDPGSAELVLSELLDEMTLLNRAKRLEAQSDMRFGLRVGRISDAYPAVPAAPGLAYDLKGVHQLAHEQIYWFFGGETDAYVEGVNYVFGMELGLQGIVQAFTFTGLALLAVVCPPALVVVGAGLAAREVERAEARRDLYRSLINPELVLDRTEVELECYIAYVGLALALLPEAGTAARALSIGMRGAARRGAVVGLRLAGRSVLRQVSSEVTEQLARDLLPALLQEFATDLLMEQVIVPAVVGPVMEAVERELRVRMSVGGAAGVERLVQQIEAEAARRAGQPPAAPDGGNR